MPPRLCTIACCVEQSTRREEKKVAGSLLLSLAEACFNMNNRKATVVRCPQAKSKRKARRKVLKRMEKAHGSSFILACFQLSYWKYPKN